MERFCAIEQAGAHQYAIGARRGHRPPAEWHSTFALPPGRASNASPGPALSSSIGARPEKTASRRGLCTELSPAGTSPFGGHTAARVHSLWMALCPLPGVGPLGRPLRDASVRGGPHVPPMFGTWP